MCTPPIYWGQRWFAAAATKHVLLWQLSMRQEAEAAPKLHFRIIFGSLPSAKRVGSISLLLRVISYSGFKCKLGGSYWSTETCNALVSTREKTSFFYVIEMVQVSWINCFHERNCALSPCDSFPPLFWRSLLTFITSFTKAGSNHNFQLTSARATKCSAFLKKSGN